MTPQHPQHHGAGLDGRYLSLTPHAVLIDPSAVVVLKASRVRRFWLLVGSLMLACAGLVVLVTGENVFWAVGGVLLLGVGAAIFVVQVVRPDSLTLRRDDFSFISLGRGTRLAWSDVAEFGVLILPARGGSTRQVGIQMKVPRSLLARRMISGTSGRFDAVLPDTYRLPVEDLTALMEEWRSAASDA